MKILFFRELKIGWKKKFDDDDDDDDDDNDIEKRFKWMPRLL